MQRTVYKVYLEVWRTEGSKTWVVLEPPVIQHPRMLPMYPRRPDEGWGPFTAWSDLGIAREYAYKVARVAPSVWDMVVWECLAAPTEVRAVWSPGRDPVPVEDALRSAGIPQWAPWVVMCAQLTPIREVARDGAGMQREELNRLHGTWIRQALGGGR